MHKAAPCCATGPFQVWANIGPPQSNAGSSIDVYFGQDAPNGKEKNWIKTAPGKGWFILMRFYGPLELFFGKVGSLVVSKSWNNHWSVNLQVLGPGRLNLSYISAARQCYWVKDFVRSNSKPMWRIGKWECPKRSVSVDAAPTTFRRFKSVRPVMNVIVS